MKKKLLLMVLSMFLLLPVVSSLCYDDSYTYGLATAYAEACGERSGDTIIFSCRRGYLYVSSTEPYCNKVGCSGTPVDNPYTYQLEEGVTTQYGTCWSIDVAHDSDDYAWVFAYVYFTGLGETTTDDDSVYDSCCLNFETKEYELKTSCDPVGGIYYSVSDFDNCSFADVPELNWFQRFIAWIKKIFSSFNTGSLVPSGGSGGGGGSL